MAAISATVASEKLFAQNDTVYSELGINSGTYISFHGSNTADGTIAAAYLLPCFRIKQHEFSGGVIFPYKVPDVTSWSGYSHRKTFGLSVRYNVFLLKPVHLMNVFWQYEFQYVYFTANYTHSAGGGAHDEIVYDNYYRNVLSLGYFCYLNQRHNSWVSLTAGYVIPFESHEVRQGSETTTDYRSYGGNDNLENYLNLSLTLGVRIKSFRR